MEATQRWDTQSVDEPKVFRMILKSHRCDLQVSSPKAQILTGYTLFC